MIKFVCLFVFFIVSFSSVYSLGISPAIKQIDFVPNQEVKINFFVLDAVESSDYDIVIGGGTLKDYSSIDKEVVRGNGMFVLTIKFPEKMDKPGQHTVSVSVKERPSEESFISTLIEVGSSVKTFVPYPGIYGDLNLNIPDANVGDKVPVELHVINRGDNPLDITEVYVDFISNNGEIAKKIDFSPVVVEVNGDRYFRKYLDSSDIFPGDYIGSAKLTYSGFKNEINKSFRVGSLFVNITNYTDYIMGNGIQKFYVTLENKWNSPISGVYVDINLSNSLSSLSFRTPSSDLNPWEKKIIESYFEADGLEGSYNLILNASYHGKSTLVHGSLLIGKDYSLIVYSISALVAIVFFLVLYLLLKYFLKKRGRK